MQMSKVIRIVRLRPACCRSRRPSRSTASTHAAGCQAARSRRAKRSVPAPLRSRPARTTRPCRRCNTPPSRATRWRNGSSGACMRRARACRATTCAPSSISAASPIPMPKTLRSFRRRASSPMPSCSSAIIICRALPIPTVKADPDRAREMYAYAASYFGDPDAQFSLAQLYLDGVGGAKIRARPCAGSSLAANKGQPRAQALLGSMLFKGENRAASGRARADVAHARARKRGRPQSGSRKCTRPPSSRRPTTSASSRWSISSAT